MYLVYELDKWWSNLKHSFATKSCFLVAFILTRSTIKRDSVYTYNGYEIAFHGVASCFINKLAWAVVIFAVDNSSSRHCKNNKNNL